VMEVLTLMQRRVRSIALPFACLLALSGCSESGGDDDASVPEKSPWAGKNYSLTIDPDLWVEPRGVGGDIGEFVPEFLLAVADEEGDSPGVTIATALSGAQNPCNATTEAVLEVPEDPGEANPPSLVATDEFLLHVVHPREPVIVDLTVHDLTFTNILPNDDDEGELSVVMDVNEAYVLFDLVPDSQRNPEGVCTVLGMADAPCAPCPFGDGGTHCLTLKAVQLAATETSIAIEPIAADDRDPSCNP
jgi:hypothetical protein